MKLGELFVIQLQTGSGGENPPPPTYLAEQSPATFGELFDAETAVYGSTQEAEGVIDYVNGSTIPLISGTMTAVPLLSLLQ